MNGVSHEWALLRNGTIQARSRRTIPSLRVPLEKYPSRILPWQSVCFWDPSPT